MNNDEQQVATILRAGARGPIGLSRLQLTMNLRAGRFVPRPCAFRDKHGRSIGTCRVGGLGLDVIGHDRLLGLAVPALRETWPEHEKTRVPLVLALPEASRPDDDVRYGPAFIDALRAKAHCPIDLERSLVIRTGHAGFANALEVALGMLYRADFEKAPQAVIVGAVDSHHHHAVLQWLDAHHRLHARGTENGIVPSEGAGFAILARPKTSLPTMPKERKPLGRLRAVSTGREASFELGSPNIAAALTQAVRDVAAYGGPLPWVLTDVNGERHRTQEWSLVSMRGTLTQDATQSAPARLLGDTGAATGALYLAIACTQWALGIAPASRAAVVLQSEGPQRGAFLLEQAS